VFKKGDKLKREYRSQISYNVSYWWEVFYKVPMYCNSPSTKHLKKTAFIGTSKLLAKLYKS
jgi:hypothetical protein